MKITEIDYTTTPETVIERDATSAEIAQWEADVLAETNRQNEIDAKIAAKASAIAKLEALGLTEDEAKALIG